MKSRAVFLLLLSLSYGISKAQLNESDTIHLQLRSSLTGNYQKGNVEALTIRGRVDFSCMPLKHLVFKSQNALLYQEFYDTKADDDIFSRNYFYYKPEQKLYPFAIVYISKNYRRKIDGRYFGGAGLTYQLLNQQQHVIKFSLSAVYEHNSFNGSFYNQDAYNGSSTINLWRGTLYVGGWSYLLEKHLRAYYDAYWQPAFGNKNNYRTQLDIGIDFPVWKGFSVTALYTLTHENVVVKNIMQEDRILTWGLSYNLRKK